MTNPIKLTDKKINHLISTAKTIAVLGCSDKKYRTSYHIAEYLQRVGKRIIPINPHIDETLGENAMDSVFDLSEEIKIDIITIFRNKSFTTGMVREIVDWSKKTGNKPLIWTQLDVSTDESKKVALDNDLAYVENRCIMVEHRKMTG